VIFAGILANAEPRRANAYEAILEALCVLDNMGLPAPQSMSFDKDTYERILRDGGAAVRALGYVSGPRGPVLIHRGYSMPEPLP
jgi:hypothetical protein